MTKKKELQKVIILFLFSLFLLSSFESTALAVDSKYDCTYAGVSCKGVNVTGHGTSVAYSDYVYAAQGQQLSVSNNSTGQFNLITELVDSSGRVVTAAPVYYTDTVVNTALKFPKNAGIKFLTFIQPQEMKLD